ncbi:zinc finger protein ZFP2 [Labrus bergylta]|uniref:zinc finger protein ZFP2 n=1 Tax=Labrus bergylta TaxID=56723 RepID=UPI00331342D1
METTMLQLRSFVHKRLHAAAEEILGEVEKTVTLALYEAEVSRSKEELESLRHQLSLLRQKQAEGPSLTSREDCDPPNLHENPGPPNPEEPNLSVAVPGPSQTSGDGDLNNWNYGVDEADFNISEIKEEEEEELCDDTSTQEIVFPSPETVKSEQDQPEKDTAFDVHPVSLDCSDAQRENNDSGEEFVKGKGEQTQTMEGNEQTESSTPIEKSHHGLPSDSHAKNEKGRSFCHLCGKGFQYIGSLMKHIKAHENKTDCSICGMTCKSSEDLKAHLKVCHNKTCFCDICGKTFESNHCLQMHEKMHAGVVEFTCQECGKTFHRKEHLIVHVRTHSGEKPYHCDVCGKAFSQSQNLTIHKRSHSGERPYHCVLCGKLFNTGSHLKAHMRYHSGEKPYPCDVCGKRFRQSGQMTRHRTTHTGERPYACHVCGMRYRFAPNLKVHLQTHKQAAAD